LWGKEWFRVGVFSFVELSLAQSVSEILCFEVSLHSSVRSSSGQWNLEVVIVMPSHIPFFLLFLFGLPIILFSHSAKLPMLSGCRFAMILANALSPSNKHLQRSTIFGIAASLRTNQSYSR
jgi:hypothetical protein